MTAAEIHQLISVGVELAHGEIATEPTNDGVLLVEPDGTEWWVTVVRQP